MYSIIKEAGTNNIGTAADLAAVFQRMAMKMDHHVHFVEEADVLPKDNDIVLKPSAEGVITVHLGFLQLGHRYHITFNFPLEMCPQHLLQTQELVNMSGTAMSNPNCHVLSVSKNDDGSLQMTVEFFAYKEKLMKEDLCLFPAEGGGSTNFKLIFNARVLGRGKGTPLLRNGIHSVGVELEDESEASDWQGFD